jgi:hypothetical protein
MTRFARIACAVAALASAPAFTQEWIPLQDGRSMAGWKAAERPEAWVVEDGAFVSRGDRSHLFYTGKAGPRKTAEFRNFELSLDVMTSPGANSGVYVHTRWQGPGWPAAGYELQVINSNPPAETMNGYVEHKMTGSIYAVRNAWAAPARDNEWFNYRIRVVGRTLQTFINDQLVCEYAEPDAPHRPDDKKLRRLASGTFALQAHDPGSVVKYRNIKVKILSDDAVPPAGVVPIADRELDELVTQASNDNIPLIDIGLSAPAGGAGEFWSQARRFGVLPLGLDQVPDIASSVVVLVDRERAPDTELLKSLKARGYRVAFSSGGATSFDEAQLKRRLLAIRDAELEWEDFWVPGKP